MTTFSSNPIDPPCGVSGATGAGKSASVYWLGGWGIAPQAMLEIAQEALPQAQHRVLIPSATALDALCGQLQGDNSSRDDVLPVIAGYSTGAFLLLRALNQLMPSLLGGRRLLLFAPFADFRAESGLGGRVVTTRLKLLLRRLHMDPLAALADFYQQSKVALPAPQVLPYAAADLIWGIEQLAQTAVGTGNLETLRTAASLNIKAWVGAGDALLDAEKIATLFAPGVCRIGQNASHDFGSLLEAAVAEGGLLE